MQSFTHFFFLWKKRSSKTSRRFRGEFFYFNISLAVYCVYTLPHHTSARSTANSTDTNNIIWYVNARRRSLVKTIRSNAFRGVHTDVNPGQRAHVLLNIVCDINVILFTHDTLKFVEGIFLVSSKHIIQSFSGGLNKVIHIITTV